MRTVDPLLDWLLDSARVAREGFGRSSFHSTLNSLKGLLDYEAATGGGAELRAARRSGEEYLLPRGLMRRQTTDEVVAPWVTRFAYPFRWCYCAVNAAGYFRAAALQDGRQPGRVWFEVDVPAGEPSKWLTFSAARVLDWWDSR